MNGYESSEDHQPVMWFRGYPLYAAHMLVVTFVISMLATTIIQFARQGSILTLLQFDSSLVLSGQVWRLFTYGLVNGPSLWFVIDMFMIVWFGRELEKTWGRRTFFIFYASIYLLTPLLFTGLGPFFPTMLAGQIGGFGLFLAFATLYPNLPLFFGLLAKYVALIFVGIYTLMHLANHNTPQLLSLWATAAFAFAFVRYQQGIFTLPRPKPKLRVLPDLKTTRKAEAVSAAKGASMAEVDALLDKIAQNGIGSLTAAERARLDAAQAAIQKRKSGGR